MIRRTSAVLALSFAAATAWALTEGASWEDDASLLAMDVGDGATLDDPLGTCSPTTPDGCLWPVENHPYTTETFDVTYDALLAPGRTITSMLRMPSDLPLGETAPLVVLSHGGSDGFVNPGQAVPGWANAFAKAGYATVAIGHRARSAPQIAALCAELGLVGQDCGGTLSYDRPYDLREVIDFIHDQVAGPWASKGIDLQNIALFGYSAGASGVLISGGLPRTLGNRVVNEKDTRVDAIIAVSPNAGGSGISRPNYVFVDRPVMMITGLGDIADGDGPGATVTNAALRFEAWTYMLEADHYFLNVLDPVPDHGFYSMKLDDCAQDLGLPRCQEIANWLRTTAVAYLDANLRGDPIARAWLASSDLSIASDAVTDLTVSVDRDADNDRVADDVDVCTGNDATGDIDNDGTCADVDTDDDGDGIPDASDLCLGANGTGDPDFDGLCNDLDPDDDGDGFPDDVDTCPADGSCGDPVLCDADGDGYGDSCDLCWGNDDTGDSDADDVCDDLDACYGDDALGDADNDGTCAGLDACDLDANKVTPGACGCGSSDTDRDNDSVLDCLEETLVLDGDTSLVSFGTSPFASFTGHIEIGGGLLAPDLRAAGANATIGVSIGTYDIYGFTAPPTAMTVIQSGLTSDNRETWEFKKSTRELGSFRWTDSQSYSSVRDTGMPLLGTPNNLGTVVSQFIRTTEARLRVTWDSSTRLPLTITIDGIVLASISCTTTATPCTTYAVDTEMDNFEVYSDGSSKRTWDVGFPDDLGDGNVMAWYQSTVADLPTATPIRSHEAIDNGSASSTFYNAGGAWSLTVPIGAGPVFGIRAESTVGLWLGTGGLAVSGCYTFGTGGYVVDNAKKQWRSNEVAEDATSVSYPTGDIGFDPLTIYLDTNGDQIPDNPAAGRSWCRVPAGWTQ